MVYFICMSKLSTLTPESFDEWIEKAVQLVAAGARPKKVASEFDWQVEDVEDLLRSKNFERRLKEVDPFAWQALQEQESNLFLVNVKQKIRDNTEEYVDMLSELARSARSEQVRLNALTQLMKLGEIGKTDEVVEIVEVAEAHWKRMEEAFAAVLKNGPKSIREHKE